jgi:Flp pilus assembly protein TadG
MSRRLGIDADHGAAAVELALVLPILILLIGGIIDFGLAFNAQISLTHAAREGARVEAIGPGDGKAAAEDAYVQLATEPALATVVDSCPGSDSALVRVTATYNAVFYPPLSRSLSSQAVMRCNG